MFTSSKTVISEKVSINYYTPKTMESQPKNVDKSTKNGNGRTRTFAFIMYPDSMADNFIDKLTEFHVPTLISPLHDKDVNPDGTPKKPHYHVLIMYDSVKTLTQAQEVRDAVNGVGWENVSSVRGYARYLCHLDNPEKARYKEEDVIELNGADYAECIKRITDEVKAILEMQDFIDEYEVYSYAKFVQYCRKYKTEWAELLVKKFSYSIDIYIKSLMYTEMYNINCTKLDKLIRDNEQKQTQQTQKGNVKNESCN